MALRAVRNLDYLAVTVSFFRQRFQCLFSLKFAHFDLLNMFKELVAVTTSALRVGLGPRAHLAQPYHSQAVFGFVPKKLSLWVVFVAKLHFLN